METNSIVNLTGFRKPRTYYSNQIKILAACIGILLVQTAASQFNPGLGGRFGIDGDILHNQRAQGSFPAAGSHDWFSNHTSGGLAIFDTAGAAFAKNRLMAGENYSFARVMQYPYYSSHDSTLQVDGLYIRDYFGINKTSMTLDRTAFTTTTSGGANSNAMAPASWTTNPSGLAMPSKVDLIDIYVSMYRDGTSISSTNPSPLHINMAGTSMGYNGDRYLDFELFRLSISYDTVTGKFSGAGPDSTGGRSAWTFAADGSLLEYGDMTLGFSFGNSSVNDISIYIWTSYSNYTSVSPSDFDFVPDTWNGLLPNSGYGYVKIAPNAGALLQAWGAVNTVQMRGPQWGTNSTDLGTQQQNLYSTDYAAGQFAEASINLTSLGLDQIFTKNNDCNPPFQRFMAKSRSSSSFSSALQDFIAPQQILNLSSIQSSIMQPSPLTCNDTTVVLSPVEYIEGANYSWSTSDGNIVSGANTAFPVVDAVGTYTLTASLFAGCFSSSSSITVAGDQYKPVASATYLGAITDNPQDSVTLLGGDTAASNYSTPFGYSMGLTWNWSGPNGFTADIQNPKTDSAGYYQLIVTEIRNGCTDTATVKVWGFGQVALPVQFNHFDLNRDSAGKVGLIWTVASLFDASHFIVEKSFNGRDFFQTAVLLITNDQIRSFSYYENYQQTEVYYRIRSVTSQGTVSFSNTKKLDAPSEPPNRMLLMFDGSRFVIQYRSDDEEEITLEVVNGIGQMVYSTRYRTFKGMNHIPVSKYTFNNKGLYIFRISNNRRKIYTRTISNVR